MEDKGANAGAAHGYGLVVEFKDVVSLLASHSPQHQDLPLDGFGLHVQILLPAAGQTARVDAPGLGDVRGEPVVIVGEAVGLRARITFSHLADAFIQSDLQGCIHILH